MKNNDEFQRIFNIVDSNPEISQSILNAKAKGLTVNCPRLWNCSNFPCETLVCSCGGKCSECR